VRDDLAVLLLVSPRVQWARKTESEMERTADRTVAMISSERLSFVPNEER